MPGLNANVARYFFESASLPPEVFQVARFRGYEEISRLFRYELELVSTDAYVDFASVVNQPATFTMMRGTEPVATHGLVVDFRQEGRSKDYVAYRVVLAPRLWQLSLTYQSRIFQHLTVDGIITQVLQEAGLGGADFEISLAGSFPPMEYVVQHRETDLNFFCRLLEKYGIFFYFKHDGEQDKLIITDDKQSLGAIAAPSALDYHELEGMVAPDVEVVHEFTAREQIVTGKVVLKDYNYRTPDSELKVESQLNGSMPGVYYEYGEHYKDAGAGQQLAQIRNEEIESRRREFEGSSNCVGLRCGHTYSLGRHYRKDFNEDYLITWVQHQGSQRHALGLDAMPQEGTSPEIGVTYGNLFRCRPLQQPFRPARRTPVPQIPGIMMGKVERRAGPYAHIDDQGRYRAKMRFDLGETGSTEATKSIRMNQPYSGPNYGIHFPNHENTEIIWACINGDIDRPMALGTVPNPNQGSPSTASNKWQSVIRTWGKNELTFDDKVGEENIYMFATKDHTVEVTNDESFTVGHDQATDVTNDQTIHVGHDRTKAVDNDQIETVGRNRTRVVGNDEAVEVVNNRSKVVGVNQAETVGRDKTIGVGGNHTETITQNMTQAVGQNVSQTVGQNVAQTVGATKTETIAIAKTLSVGAAYQISVGAAMNETVVAAKAQEIGGAKIVVVGLHSSETVGMNKSIKANNKVSIKAGEKMVLQCGDAQIILQENGDIQIKGNNIVIKGSKVDIN